MIKYGVLPENIFGFINLKEEIVEVLELILKIVNVKMLLKKRIYYFFLFFIFRLYFWNIFWKFCLLIFIFFNLLNRI